MPPENWFSDTFRGCWKRPVVWNGLIITCFIRKINALKSYSGKNCNVHLLVRIRYSFFYTYTQLVYFYSHINFWDLQVNITLRQLIKAFTLIFFEKKNIYICIYISVWVFFHNHSRITGLLGREESVSLDPHYHFHPRQKHLDISRPITAESSPLHIGSSRTRTGNLWFPSPSC